MTDLPASRLSHARVLVELGELFDAEIEVAEILDQHPDDLDALSLFAKVKHMRGELSQAEACIAELSGELSAACQSLERLGLERGFETDLDRVYALVRLYERLGSRENLESAVHICSYLERQFHKLSTLGQLARLYQRLAQG